MTSLAALVKFVLDVINAERTAIAGGIDGGGGREEISKIELRIFESN